MATNPTRLQQRAADQLAEALVLITEAYRQDGKATLSQAERDELVSHICRVSSAFSREDIVVRALERRAKALALPAAAVDLITLQDGERAAMHALWMSDQELTELVRQLEEELGEFS